MASTTIGKLRTIMTLETSQFRRDAKGARSQIAGLTKGLKLMGGALAATFGARAIVGQMKEMISLFGQQELAERKMADGLKLAGDASQAALDDFKDFAAGIQSVTTLGDEAVLEIAALGAALGKMTGQQLKDATKAAIGLSKAAGIDAASAMKLLARGAQGGTVDFSRYGIVVDKALSKQEQFNQVLKVGIDAFSLAKGEADTLTGSMQQLSNAVGDLKENLGGLAAPGLRSIIDDLNSFLSDRGGGLGLKRTALELVGNLAGGGLPFQGDARTASDIMRRLQENRDSNTVRRQQAKAQADAAAAARKAYMQSEIDASRLRVQDRFKQKFGITGSEFFDFTARTGLYNFKERLSNISPISGLTKMLLGNFDASQAVGPEHSGALIKGTAAEYSARLAATGGGRGTEQKTADNTEKTYRGIDKLVDLIRDYGLNQQQAVTVVEF